ncbi:MAG: NAD(P)/FAD-dependent oxidoreductase, partial [Calditrichaeota bacterium]
AAAAGLRVLLVDKKQELGAPIQCSGAVSAHALSAVGIPEDEEFICQPVYGFIIHDAEGNGTVLDYRELKPEEYLHRPLGFVVDRRRFDRYLARMAEQTGAELWLKTEAQGYAPRSEGIAEVFLRRLGKEHRVSARVVVGADGVQSQVGRWAGLNTHVRVGELASCLQYIMDGVETRGLLELITGKRWAPGGYAWVFPRGNGLAEVGLGVVPTLADHDARYYLEQFLHHSWMKERFRNAHILEVQGGGVPLTAPLKRPCARNLILVGDAAHQVNPITGGGIHLALQSGRLAGEFLGAFLGNGGLPTADNLAEYARRWFEQCGRTIQTLYREKRRIFRKDGRTSDEALYRTLADYFHPHSPYKKV